MIYLSPSPRGVPMHTPCSIIVLCIKSELLITEDISDAFNAATSTTDARVLLVDKWTGFELFGRDENSLSQAAARTLAMSELMEPSDSETLIPAEGMRALRPTPRGSSTQNVEPLLCRDLTPSRPPLSLTMLRTRASPRPVPFPPTDKNTRHV